MHRREHGATTNDEKNIEHCTSYDCTEADVAPLEGPNQRGCQFRRRTTHHRAIAIELFDKDGFVRWHVRSVIRSFVPYPQP